MTIDQNGESMGIQYDGTTYRDVSWGKRKRDDQKIEAGWKVQDLIIKTKGGRIDVEEKYILSDDGRRLTIFVALAGSRDDMAFKRVFEKQAT